MKSLFNMNPLDPSEGFFGSDGDAFVMVPFPAIGAANPPQGGSVPTPVQTPTLPDEAVEAEAAQNGPGGPGSVVAETATGGLTINLLFDAAAMAAPASFRAGIEQAASILSATITNKITVNIDIDYSGTGGSAAAGPDGGQFESYSSVRTDLINNAAPGDTTFNALPTGSSVQGQSSVVVWNAQLKLFGLLGANNTTTDDGSATFSTDINSNLLVGVALHELTHAMGRVPYGPQPDIFDLFRFTSPGTRLFSNSIPAPSSAYFSVDGGNTKLADFGVSSDPSDFLNSGVQGSNDPFNEFYSNSTSQTLSADDKAILDALGFNTTALVATTVIESLGSTSLVQVGNDFFLDSISSGTGPELQYGGSPWVVGEWGAWTPIGAEATATGYEVAFKVAGSNLYTVWNTDTNGNLVGDSIGSVAGNSPALEALETSFHQDLNGDGVIGVPAAPATTTVIESFGSTSLVQVGSNYFLNSIASGTGPELKYGGAPFSAGEWGAWAPIGAETTATGYEVAFKVAGANTYTVWNTDSSGNITTDTIGTVTGNSTALEALEQSFHQDLNGDGTIGIPGGTVIESFGSTSLVQTGSNFLLNSTSTGTGPELKYGGAPFVAGEWGAWAPIGAEATTSGYEVAFKVAGSNLYTVWNTDSSGNITTDSIGTVAGNSTALEALEQSFHQDLNGDGVIGIPSSQSSGTSPQAPVTAVNSDTFVFRSGASVSNSGNADPIGYAGSAWHAGDAPSLSWTEAQAGEPHPPASWAGGDPSAHHDLAFADLHAGHFILR
jgi:serralysin